MAIPVVGSHISSVGGIAQFIPWGGAGGTNSTGAINAVGSNFLDVENWALDIINYEDDVTDTGTWGLEGVDITCIGAQWVANVIWDLTKPPDIMQRVVSTNNNNFQMNYSVQVSLFVGNGLNYGQSDTTLEWYYMPSCKVKLQQPVVDAHNKKDVRMRITGKSSSGCFHMPYDASVLAAYVTHCQNRGRTW